MTETDLLSNEPPPGRWLHRLSVLAVALVWPLIWIGGLVTTYDAGMAVPDWPSTYGYNLFLYPYESWLFGPFDLLIEHGHRLLGAVVGMVAIGIVGLAFLTDRRRWVFPLAIALLVAVIAQGLLGGLRVVLGDRTLAMVHGCVGPAFFALCVVMAAVTSRPWYRAAGTAAANGHRGDTPRPSKPGLGQGHLSKLTLVLAALPVLVSYTQLVLGAQLRHVQPTAPPPRFLMTVALHVAMAFLLWLLVAAVWWRLRRCGELTLSRPAVGLIGLVGIQILLGVGTWVVNYGWPDFLQFVPGASGFVLQTKGFGDSILVTAHVATGSLILGVATLELVRVWRLRHCRMHCEPHSEA